MHSLSESGHMHVLINFSISLIPLACVMFVCLSPLHVHSETPLPEQMLPLNFISLQTLEH